MFSDNGGEVIGEDFVKFCEIFNIGARQQLLRTAHEHYNQFITNMLHNVYDDAKCVYVTAFAWAVNAKKWLINNNGFSSSLLVFVRNCNLPNTVNDPFR